MKRTALLPLLLALVLPSGALAAPPAPPRLVEPAQDAVVPLLNETQRGYVLMPREERVNAYTNEAFRRALRDGGEVPAKVRFAWKGTAPEGEGPAFTVEVRRKPDGKVFFRGGTDHHHLAADGCFEIAREWEWTVSARGGASATGTFRTEDLAPRLIDGGAVPNVRDLGGRVGLGGRRVRQGLVYRSAGLNSNASDVFYTREELLAEEEELWLDWEVTAFHNRNTDFNHGRLFDKLVRGFDRWPGETINERVEAYVLDLGFTPEEIATFRGIMLEP